MAGRPGLFEMRRMEALSNTIFGVAMTLLAYQVPKDRADGFNPPPDLDTQYHSVGDCGGAPARPGGARRAGIRDGDFPRRLHSRRDGTAARNLCMAAGVHCLGSSRLCRALGTAPYGCLTAAAMKTIPR